MGMCGGDGGGYAKSTTTNEPWDVQGDYLRDLFKTSYGGLFGRDTSGDPLGKNSKFTQMFKGVDEYGNPVPGKLDYIGEKQNMWSDFDDLQGQTQGLGSSQLQTSIAPTVAGFSPEELTAQNIIKARAQGQSKYTDDFGRSYDTGYNTLIPEAQGALGNIISGANRINPAGFDSASVNAPSEIIAPGVRTPDSYQAPTIGNTDLGYRYWDDLGSMAGGKQNPYLENMISNAKGNLRNEYQNYEVPALANTAEAAGRYGGNTWGKLRTDLANTYTDKTNALESTMRGDAFNTQMSNALQAMNLGGNLAESQAGMNQNQTLQQANMENARRTNEYNTNAEANRLQAGLNLEADTSQAGNELQRNTQNALLEQDASRTGAGFEQEANMQNIANILGGSNIAPGLNEASYGDISKLAAVGESQSQKQQDIIDAFINKFNFNQNEPNIRLANMSNILSGDLGGTSTAIAPQTSSGGCF